jgi:hypothetical protein
MAMRFSVNTDQPHIDVTAPDAVQVQLDADGKTFWVNVNGVCMFRACQIKKFQFDDLAHPGE